MPIVQSPQRKQSGKDKRKVDLFIVGVDEAKLTVMRRLDLEKKGPGYCHFPHDRESEWYRQLTAEKLIIRYVKGQPIREWHKPDRARNEALDCRVYALAALKIMQPNLKRVSERVSIDLPDQPKAERIENAEVKSKTIVKRRIVKKAQEKFVAPKVKKKRIFGNKT